MLKKMRIAIFHNYMDNIGGAERVALSLARELNADIYTTNIDFGKIRLMGFDDVKINSIGKVPLNAPLRQQLSLYRFRKLNLKNNYDLYIIAGDWAMSGAVNNKPNLWYVHSPIREIWDLYEYTRKNTVPFFLRNIFDLWVYYNRYLNRKYVKHVDRFVANSKNTSERLKKYLNKDSVIINPPIETLRFKGNKNGDYWLSVNRLISHKRIDMQMKAFSELPDEKLIVVGSYEMSRHFKKYVKFIEQTKPKNVEIISWADDHKVDDLYANCKGFITTSHDEDFGMTAVEAMAAGKFVIAPNEGGYKETVINGKSGILIDKINADKLVDVIKNFNSDSNISIDCRDYCVKQAKNYDINVFIDKIKEQINNIKLEKTN